MRHARIHGEPPHGAVVHAEPFHVRSFIARFKQRLQSETDSEERNLRRDAVQQSLPHVHLIKSPHHLAKVTHARQNNFRCAPQSFRITDQLVRRADFIQRVLHRPQIARAVIEDRNHRSPLVDGS